MRSRSPALDAAVRALTPLESHVYSLDTALSIRDELTGFSMGGQVALSRSRGGRSLSASFTTPDGSLVPRSVIDPLFPDNLLMVTKGLPAEPIDLGIFTIDSPESSTESRDVRLMGADRWRLGSEATFATTVPESEGTPLAEVMRRLAVLAGMGEYRLRLDDAGRALTMDRTFLPRESIVTAMLDLALDHGLRLRVEADWTLDMRPVPDPELQRLHPVWTFAPGPEAIVTVATRGLSSASLRNSAPVGGTAPGRPSVYWEERVTDPANPAHESRIGYRPGGLYSSPAIRTEEQAYEVSRARLPTLALLTSTYRLRSLAHPCIEDDDVVRLVEPFTGSDTVLWLDDLTQPFGNLPEMSLGASELIPLR